jgi:hypothetical protein
MAILYGWQGKNDGGCDGRPRADCRLRNRRCRVRIEDFAHYIENTGDTDLKFLEMFKSSYFQDLSLSEWLTHEPPDLVKAHLNLDKDELKSIPRETLAIVPR